MAIDEMARKHGEGKAHTFARQYILNNLYGIEKEMFLYVLSCLELAHFLQSLNMRFKADERFHLYCSDALENRTGNVQFNVILGNLPSDLLTSITSISPKMAYGDEKGTGAKHPSCRMWKIF